LNVERLDHAHARDDAEATLSALREATDKSDLVLTVGGVSAGRRDHVPWAVGELGFETVVKGVAIQPGKPVFIAQACDGSGRLVVGLPGNPVSVLATAHLFAWPIIRAMSGFNPVLPWRRVQLGETVTPNPRREAFRLGESVDGNTDKVRVIGWKGSGDLAHTARADGFVRLPMRQEELRPGDPVWFLPVIGGARW
jgi:molybdopterin molybdotransferase